MLRMACYVERYFIFTSTEHVSRTVVQSMYSQRVAGYGPIQMEVINMRCHCLHYRHTIYTGATGLG